MTVFKELLQAFDDPEGGEGNKGGSDDGGQKSGKSTDNGAKDGKSKDGGADGKGADEKKYSDADLDKIINQKFAKWQKDQEKAVSEAKKLASMTEQEKAEHERDEIKKELEALKKANNMAEMGKQARKMLNEDGINIPDDLVNLIIAEDAETTKDTVQQFSKLFKAAVQDAVKEALKGKTPGTGSSGTITKEQIMKIKDRTERQRMIQKHRDLFK
jgi:hypothetical protein